LTVDAHRAGSHQGRGWERFTDAVIRRISDSCDHVVFMLWGSYAIKKAGMIDRDKHLVLTSPHPSPLSAYRGFFGNHHFSICNSWLSKYGKEPVVW
ncbi:MAG: uracil-DNA glycosylase, partial [Muribaculaceae bacterium]|nr:uracil-DNA glycosylase [Muribaculaceae bacterium]